MTVDAFTTGPLRRKSLVERTLSIERDAHLSSQFDIAILVAPFAFGELSVGAALACWKRKKQWTTVASGLIARGMGIVKNRMHAQAHRTAWHTIRVALEDRMSMLIFRHRRNATLTSRLLIDVPGGHSPHQR